MYSLKVSYSDSHLQCQPHILTASYQCTRLTIPTASAGTSHDQHSQHNGFITSTWMNVLIVCQSKLCSESMRHILFDIITYRYIFSCDQAALRLLLSVCLSLLPSVCLSHLFSPCSCHHTIMKFSGVITIDKSDVHARGQGQRSRSQRSKPNLAVTRL